MFIVANRNINLPNADYTGFFKVTTGFLGQVPEEFTKTDYFAALVKDGKIVVSGSTADKELVRVKETADKKLSATENAKRKKAKDT